MNWRTLYTLSLAVIGILALAYWWRRDNAQLTSNVVSTPRGYYLTDALIRQTGTNGNPRYSLHAASIEQDPADDSIDARQVTLNYQIAPDTQWLLTADSGHVPAASRSITFNGNVLIKPANGQTAPVTMRTGTLTVDMLNDLASAPGKVTIEMNQRRLTGVGLRADLQQQQVRIESQVHGQFTIQQP
jgi:LPS export ABC transporter protein LptC